MTTGCPSTLLQGSEDNQINLLTDNTTDLQQQSTRVPRVQAANSEEVIDGALILPEIQIKNQDTSATNLSGEVRRRKKTSSSSSSNPDHCPERSCMSASDVAAGISFSQSGSRTVFGERFSKNPEERHMILQQRKEQMIANSRR